MARPQWFKRLAAKLRGSMEAIDPDWPEWYRAYAADFAHPSPGPDASLSAISLTVLDAETTGLDVHEDRIISLGALTVRGNSISLADKFEAYLPSPVASGGTAAIIVHGIIPNSQRYHYSEAPQLLGDLLAYLGTRPIVGHHIGFDVEMINRALARQGAGPLRNRVIDTAVLAQRLQPAGYWSPPQAYSLDTLAKRYRIPLSDRHTALGDCYITAVLWLKLLTRLAAKLNRDLRLSDV